MFSSVTAQPTASRGSLRRISTVIALAGAFGLMTACSSSGESDAASVPTTTQPDAATGPGTVSATCSVEGDCAAPLSCVDRRCHLPCESSRDCPEGQRCMASSRPSHFCQLPEEERCTYNSECPQGQACAADGKCRDECSSDSDCVIGQTCVSGGCAEPSELDGGRLPSDGDAGDTVSGQPCSYDSECLAPLVCRDHLCAFECLANVDCADGKVCTEHRCAGEQ